jgi:hypothetical protein
MSLTVDPSGRKLPCGDPIAERGFELASAEDPAVRGQTSNEAPQEDRASLRSRAST